MEAAGRLLRRATRSLVAGGAPNPLLALLGPTRRRACREVLLEVEPRARALHPDLARGDAGARASLAQLADAALAEMRRRVTRDASISGQSARWAASADDWWRRTDELEHLDDPTLDPAVRVRIVTHLDAMNELLGSYRHFFERLRPMLEPGRPTRVLDLASGHGGFALALARASRDQSIPLEVVASDIKPEYLALGAARAREEGLALRTSVQDALDLSNLRRGDFDVVTCTQALHHFNPGRIAVMFAEASRIASRGVLFIDGTRNALTAATTWMIGRLGFRDREFAHDSLVSFRRFFVPEELELLGRLTPSGERARAATVAPGHCVLELPAG
ncbi:MAG: methyltransferase domain-containing protein [Polyangiaceae bacterium]|nr:methyltransferase domain-containing protein [Polyangiaceae bacterium]